MLVADSQSFSISRRTYNISGLWLGCNAETLIVIKRKFEENYIELNL